MAEARPRPARLVDIAKAVGVHVSIVSRTLSADPALTIRPETRERILLTAEKLGYRANALARGLKLASAGAVGVVIPSLRNPVWSEVVRGVLDEAAARDVVVLLAEVPDDTGDDTVYMRLVEEGRIDGLIFGSSGHPTGKDHLTARIPYVHVNRAVRRGAGNIVMDEARAVRLIFDHLTQLGHHHIGHVDGPKTVDTTRRRVAALRRLSTKGGHEPVIVHTAFDEAGGHRGMRQLLERGDDTEPTVVAVTSVNQLIGALAALREAKIAVPADLSIVTYDEDPLLDYLDVRVTSVQMPLFEMGQAALRALMDRLAGKPGRDVRISEPMHLVVRSSTAPVS